MAQATIRGRFASQQSFEQWQARRRWARAGIVYTVMLAFAILFMGPLLFATVSSLKVDPLEYPPSLNIPQLYPKNWSAASRLGVAGSGNPFLGGFAPGANVPFEITYFVPSDQEAVTPLVEVARRRPGGGFGAVLQIEYAADYAEVSEVTEVSRRDGEFNVRGENVPGEFITYGFTVTYPEDPTVSAELPTIDRLPLDITTEAGMYYSESTLTASRLERRGRVASFDNATPGFVGYTFRNFVRVFNEAKSVSTGQSLFANWITNSFVFAIFRIIVTLGVSSMAGYALARLNFPGKNILFVVVLLAQMIPLQVLFISNYLVLNSGIWGLSRLWGQETLLNSLTGLVFVTALNAGAVFIMKQFFESIPREVEEAAMIDGTNQWQRFSRVVLPMARPALGALTILTFQGAWNDFFWPFIVLTSPDDIKTLPIGMLTFRQLYGAAGDWGMILAGAILSAVPVIIIFVVFQKYFMEGVSYGGGKE
jgi:multiple sugar transport system permease protein